MAVCPSCGTANPDAARFCMACAAPLAAPSPVREERKTVTVLFADLAGFTARSDGADPEDVRAMVRPFHELLRHEIEAFGGTLARIVGDAGMAVFGYPVAHEDDPERAVRAGLAILGDLVRLDEEQPGLDLHARIGINTAEAVVTYGSALEDADDLMGDGVNLAARLQGVAPVDGIVVGEATYRATSRLFEYADLGPVEVRGKAGPVPVWRAIEPLARPTAGLGAETTPFVGRDFELASLAHLFERSRTTPSVEFVTIVAEPGMGKSRLVRELARHVDGLPDLVTWRVGRCLPYGEGIAFWALGEIIKAHAGILDTDDQRTLSARLDTALTEPDPSLRAWMKDRLGPLVGIATTTEPPQREEAFTAWRGFLEAIARERPTVLVIEDLHWADDDLVAFLRHLAERTSGVPLLLVTTARPEIEERHPSWLGRARRSTLLSLPSLADREMTSLVEATLPGASTELLATVLERAGGSPLYAGQLAAMFRDRLMPIAGASLDETAVPPGIQALLAARIDALPPATKSVVLEASVIGKVFWSGAVAALAGQDAADVEPRLADLARRDLIRPVFPSSMAGDLEFAFVHALVRDVAYGALPRAARMLKHREVAEWITHKADGEPGELSEIVVSHLERALGLIEAIGPAADAPGLREALATALLAAADHAMHTQPATGVADLRRVLELQDARDPGRGQVLARLGRALVATSAYPDAVDVLEEASGLFAALGDASGAAELAVPLNIALFYLGASERADAALARARAVFEASPGPGLATVVAAQASSAIVAFHDDRARELADEAIDLAARLGIPPPPRALSVRGWVRYPTDPQGGASDLRRAVDGAQAQGDLHAAVTALFNLAVATANAGGPSGALAAWDEAIAYSAAHGLPTEFVRAGRLDTLFYGGMWDEVLAEASPVMRWADAHGDRWTRDGTESTRASVWLERGEWTGSHEVLLTGARSLPSNYAATAAEAAFAVVGPADARRILAEGLAGTAPGELADPARFVRACLRAGERSLAGKALALGSPASAMCAAETIAAEAMLAEADNDLEAARAAFERAAAAMGSLGMAPEHAYALAGLGRCLLALGSTDAGVERLRASRGTWARLKAAPRLAEIDALLAAARDG